MIKENKLSVMAILETQVQGSKMKKIADLVFNKWSWISNNFKNKGTTRIIVGWDPDVCKIQMVDMNDQVIHCKVFSCDGKELFFFFCHLRFQQTH